MTQKNQTCKTCKKPIRIFNYILGPEWMHYIPEASFPTEARGTAWRYCKMSTAQPEDNPTFLVKYVRENDISYLSFRYWCPGCEYIHDGEMVGGLCMLPVDLEKIKSPSWKYTVNDDNQPTLFPSILNRKDYTRVGGKDRWGFVCHSYLVDGVIEFLSDCTHDLAGLKVTLPPLPDWVVNE